MQGLRGKNLLLELVLKENIIDVYCVTESWIDCNELSTQCIDNYSIISSSHRSNFIRGGTLILVKNGHKAKNRLDVVKMTVEKHFEISCIEMDLLFIVSVYRSPCGNVPLFINKLEECLCKLNSNNNKSIIVCGDFNIKFSLEEGGQHELSDLMDSFLLRQTIFQYTRVTDSCSSCIDNIFTDCKVLESNVFQGILSDHYAQRISINYWTSKNTTSSRMKRISNKVRINALNLDLQYEFRGNNINSFKDFFNIFVQYLNKHLPLKQMCVTNKKKFADWATPAIVISKDRLFNLYDLLKYNTNPDFRAYVSRYSKIFKQVTIKAKQMFLKNKVINADNKIKMAWDIIKQETGKSKDCNTKVELTIGHETISDSTTIANHANNFFSSIAHSTTQSLKASKKVSLNYLEAFITRNTESAIFATVTYSEIKKVISGLKSKRSQDLWSISPVLLKSLSSVIGPLTDIVNDCLKNGTFPDSLKIAKVIPLHKKGCHNNVENYRPISILPVFSKVFEKILEKRLLKFFTENELLNCKQFGFRKGLSTGDAIASMIKSILTSLESSQHTYGIFCDLSKAFDCVNHEILLMKLEHYGIRDNELRIFQSYLGNRTQICEVNGLKSNVESIVMGVPQGSILGPLLFLIYVNDISSCVTDDIEMVMFADDISVVLKNNDVSKLRYSFVTALESLKAWFQCNNLLLNVNKTNMMHFALGTRRCNYNDDLSKTAENLSLNLVNELTFLGVIFDKSFTWKPHINSLAGKLSSACYAIKKIKELCGTHAAKTVYHAYFESIMSYGLMFWGTAADSNRIFLLQKRALRYILNMKTIDSCRAAFGELGIMTLPSAYVYQNICYARKHIHDSALNSDNHNYDTRCKNDVQLVRHRLSKTSKSFICNSVRFYNKLSLDIKKLDENNFKRQLKVMLIKKSYYTVKDALADKNFI